MPIVENTQARVISIGGVSVVQDPKTGAARFAGKDIDLMPGVNDVPDEAWKAAVKHPAIAAMVKEGVLKIEEGRADLSEMNATKAVELVGKTFDRALLEAWFADEKRSTVLSAIEDQLEAIDLKAAEGDATKV